MMMRDVEESTNSDMRAYDLTQLMTVDFLDFKLASRAAQRRYLRALNNAEANMTTRHSDPTRRAACDRIAKWYRHYDTEGLNWER